MTIEIPPEIADGGYWYVVATLSDEHGTRPEMPEQGEGWCAWYGTVDGALLCAVRTPLPVAGVRTVDVPVAAVLAAAGAETRPYGRIGGR